jgi:hypothetical protein
MTPDSFEDKVENLLNPGSVFSRLQREINNLLKTSNWQKEEVDHKIQELAQNVKTDNERGRYQKLYQEVQNRYLQRAREKIREAEKISGDVKFFDAQAINRLLDEALKWSKDIDKEVEELRRLVGEHNNLLQMRETFKRTKEKCESLWAKATTLADEGATGSTILDAVYSPAQNLAAEALVRFPESLDLLALRDRAQQEYNDARRKYQILTTADATGSYKSEWEFLRKKKNQDENLPLVDAQGRPLGVFTVGEAIHKLEELAEEYAHNKSHEYLAEARHLLEQLHNPEAAKVELLKYETLWMLHPDDESLFEKEIKTKIDPAIKSLQDARAMLHEAELISDPQRAWTKTEEAAKVFPYVNGLDQVRLNLADRFLNRAENAIKDGQDLLERYKNDSDNNLLLDEAQRNLETALIFARQINDYGVGKEGWQQANERSSKMLGAEKKIRQNILDERNLAVSLLTESERIVQLIGSKPEQAAKSWSELVKKHSIATLERFSATRDLRMRIDLLKNADEILKRLDDAFNSKDETRLNNALQECSKALDTSSDNDALKKRLQEREGKLRGRLHYLQGLSALKNKNGDEALVEFEQLLVIPNHPDAVDAKSRSEEIKQEQKNSRKVESEIADAKAKLKYNPRGAYEKLEKLSASTIIRGNEISDLLEDAREKWKNKLLADIKTVLSTQPLNVKKLYDIATEILKELPEPRPVDEANNALAVASEHQARLKSRQLRWAEAYKAWQEALKYDSSNEEYMKELQNARFEQLYSDFDRTRDPAQAKQIIETLAAEMPNDVRRWELEARYYFQLARNTDRTPAERLVSYDEAKIALRMVREGISRLSDSDTKSHYESRLDRLAGGNDEETLLRRQADLERRVSSDRSLADLVKAVNEAKDFVEKPPLESRASMQDWWDSLRQSVVAKLVRDYDALGDGADDLWKRFEIRCKIVNLEPNHQLARNLIQSIPNDINDVTNKIDREVRDYLAANVIENSKDPMRIIERQRDNIFTLLSKSNILYDTLMRLSDAIGQNRAETLRSEISEKMVELQRWLGDIEDLRRMVLQLHAHGQIARQTNNWVDFQNTVDLLVNKGFGGHKSVRILVEQKDSVSEERNRLFALQSQVVKVAQDPSGEHFQDVIDLLAQLKSEDQQDQYGFQTTLTITDSFTNKPVKSSARIWRWAEKCRDQISDTIEWLGEVGLQRLSSENLTSIYSLTDTQTMMAWDKESLDKAKPIIRTIADKGYFDDALRCLRFIEQEKNALLEKSKSRNIQYLLQDILRLAEKRYPLQETVKKISTPPVNMDQALSLPVKAILQSLQSEAKELQFQSDILNTMSSDIIKRRNQWKDAQSEYEQALHQLKIAKQPRAYILPADSAKVQSAELRLQKAILTCREIASNHHYLDGIGESQ